MLRPRQGGGCPLGVGPRLGESSERRRGALVKPVLGALQVLARQRARGQAEDLGSAERARHEVVVRRRRVGNHRPVAVGAGPAPEGLGPPQVHRGARLDHRHQPRDRHVAPEGVLRVGDDPVQRVAERDGQRHVARVVVHPSLEHLKGVRRLHALRAALGVPGPPAALLTVLPVALVVAIVPPSKAVELLVVLTRQRAHGRAACLVNVHVVGRVAAPGVAAPYGARRAREGRAKADRLTGEPFDELLLSGLNQAPELLRMCRRAGRRKCGQAGAHERRRRPQVRARGEAGCPKKATAHRERRKPAAQLVNLCATPIKTEVTVLKQAQQSCPPLTKPSLMAEPSSQKAQSARNHMGTVLRIPAR